MRTANYVVIFAVMATLATKASVLSISSSPELNISRKRYKIGRNNDSINGLTTESSLRHSTIKKWQVGRVSRKHYEIVNMLWRKTKFFSDEEPITLRNTDSDLPKNNPPIMSSELLSFTTHLPLFQSSTPSFIEFYYLDDHDERLRRRDITNVAKRRPKSVRNDKVDIKQGRYPILSFHVDEPEFRVTAPSQKIKPSFYDKKQIRSKVFYDKNSMSDFIKSKLKANNVILSKIKSISRRGTSPHNNFDDQTCPVTFESAEENNTTSNKNNPYGDVSTRFYDKIKFFEKYDKNTRLPIEDDYLSALYNGDVENSNKENQIDDNQRMLLLDVHKNIGHHDDLDQKQVKKHIHNDFEKQQSNNMLPKQPNKTDQKLLSKNKSNNEKSTIKYDLSTYGQKMSKISSTTNSTNLNILSTHSKKMFLNYSFVVGENASKPALWSNYPFAAVYVYEPSQIHCDAAALSPHWLVTAGACLSRYHFKNDMTERRSAFVAYCGENWWHPERVSYVKYIVVHPRFHHKDEKRRYLYNIGLIQVVGSMASACMGWKPISLISHNFEASEEGFPVATVGWGLDRYDPSYFQRSVYSTLLRVYKSLVYSSSCPGHTGYSKMKIKREEEAVKNMYCVLLPPYNGEENDPVHGSMLLVGGKLIGLYLQEERRPSGVQSAQYTGVWKLLPWVLEAAREPEDSELFGVDI